MSIYFPILEEVNPPVAIQIQIEAERPLCVDLDGTLVKSDTFVDSLMVLARRHPGALLHLPRWAMHTSSRKWLRRSLWM
jgi:hypothetical protein